MAFTFISSISLSTEYSVWAILLNGYVSLVLKNNTLKEELLTSTCSRRSHKYFSLCWVLYCISLEMIQLHSFHENKKWISKQPTINEVTAVVRKWSARNPNVLYFHFCLPWVRALNSVEDSPWDRDGHKILGTVQGDDHCPFYRWESWERLRNCSGPVRGWEAGKESPSGVYLISTIYGTDRSIFITMIPNHKQEVK